jgi:phosphatidylserine decarboxylase
VSEPNALSQTLALFSPIHKDGYKFVAVAAAVTIFAFMLSSSLGLLGLIATGALAFFFRDPKRIVPMRDGLVVAPADGTVVNIENTSPPVELGLAGDTLTRVSIFLSLLDVHVARSPISGRIQTSVYNPGVHHNAAAPEAPSENERHGFAIETKDALRVGVVLVAGAAARRIVTDVRQGDGVAAGERIGIIRFGSRVDIYLPASPAMLVAEGQRMIAGETVIADLEAHEPPRAFRRI